MMKPVEDWTERDYWFWLLSIPGLYRKNLMVLLEYFCSPRGVFEAPASELAVFDRHGMKWVRRLKGKQTYEQAAAAMETMKEGGVSLIVKGDPEWNDNLSNIADPPYGLFVRGALPRTEVYTAAVVGARSCTPYGKMMASEIGEAAAHLGIQVVSGMALGIDGFAQKACVEAGGQSFAVLGCGAEECYPREHIELYERLKDQGGIISEFPCGTTPLRTHFPMRNRLISGLADAVIVVEAREKSGSLITADLALEQGRDVFAVPGRSKDVLSGGCNRLIAAGAAGIAASTQQLMEELCVAAEVKGKSMDSAHGNKKTCEVIRKVKTKNQNRSKKVLLAPDEELVYSFLDLSPESLSALSALADMDVIRTGTALTGLVLKGLAEEIGQNQYIRR